MAQYNMPKPNEALKDFFKDNDVYASVFNDFLFKEKIVDPNDLEPEDSAYAETIIKNSNTVKINKYRDIVRRTKQGHLIIGIEDQDKIHYAMPVRKMLYDSLSYTAELSAIAALSGILANDYNLYKAANESRGGEKPMCEVLRKRDERLLAEVNAKRDAERDALLAEQKAKQDALIAENEALREQIRLLQAAN